MQNSKREKRFSLTIEKKQNMAETGQQVAMFRPAIPSIRKLTREASKSSDSNGLPSTPPGHHISMQIIDETSKRAWLWKWTNYIKGYQKRWFVLDDGKLSYYRCREEITHSCRGTINLCGAYIETMNRTYFVVRNGTSQVFHLKAPTEEEKLQWVTALTKAKSQAIRVIESEVDATPGRYKEGDSIHPADSPIDSLQTKLLDLQNNYDNLQRKGQQLLQVINTGDTLDHLSPVLKEKFTLYSLTATSLLKKANEYCDSAVEMFAKCQKAFIEEERQREELANEIESLANQLVELENQCPNKDEEGVVSGDLDPHLNESLSGSSSFAEPIIVMSGGNPNKSPSKVPSNYMTHRQNGMDPFPDTEHDLVPPDYNGYLPPNLSEDDDEFFDVSETSPHLQETYHTKPVLTYQGKDSILCGLETCDEKSVDEGPCPYLQPGPEGLNRELNTPKSPSQNFLQNLNPPPTLANRRKSIPPRPNVRLSYWSLLKNFIGKDLSKIPMPVHFNEPLSFLQRMLEEFEYSKILETAACKKDSLEQLCYVVGFTVSSYSTTVDRTTKPFNPLLGETYECDRRNEAEWRVFMEQVSHHPPAIAIYAEHKNWVHWQDFTASSKFRGKYLTVIPHGVGHLAFYSTGNHYTWRKVTSTVHNIIVGKLWIDQHGEMEIINHKTRDRCRLKYFPYSYFSRERHRRVTGTIFDANKEKRFILRGYWDEYMEYAPVSIGPGGNQVIGDYKRCWTGVDRKLHKNMYNLTDFALLMNEMEPGIAPTDCRNRPDQRKMEEGDFDASNKIKTLLEEKQRAKRRERESYALKALELEQRGEFEEAQKYREESEYKPFWFEKQFDPCTNTLVHIYKGGYWEAKESTGFEHIKTPDIYL